MAKRRDPPASRARNLRHEPVDVEATQEPAYLRTLPQRIGVEANGGRGQFVAQIAIGKAVHGVLAAVGERSGGDVGEEVSGGGRG